MATANRRRLEDDIARQRVCDDGIERRARPAIRHNDAVKDHTARCNRVKEVNFIDLQDGAAEDGRRQVVCIVQGVVIEDCARNARHVGQYRA